MSLYEKQKLLGMLSPYAEPYHPVMGELMCEEKATEKKPEVRKEDSEAENHTLKNEKKDTDNITSKGTQPSIHAHISNKITSNNTEWKIVRKTTILTTSFIHQKKDL